MSGQYSHAGNTGASPAPCGMHRRPARRSLPAAVPPQAHWPPHRPLPGTTPSIAPSDVPAFRAGAVPFLP